MKNKKYLILISILMLACNNLLAVEVISAQKPLVSGMINPALIGINAFRIVVIYNPQLGKDDLFFRELGIRTEQRVIEADPRLAQMIEAGYAARYLNIPVLRINIDRILLDPLRPPIFYVQTSFSADITLNIRPASFLRVDLWSRAETIQAESPQTEFQAISSLVGKHVELFIADFIEANSPLEMPADVNDFSQIPIVEPKKEIPDTTKEKNKTEPQKNNLEYNYIASKNSQIFHKADCSWAKRILQKNKITFKTREQALEANKKPCKKCQP